MPLFIWSMYATSIIQVLATPVVGITFLLLAMERMFGVGFFDPAKGGDPILFQHFFWFYSHPVVYVMILPAMGVISEVVPVFSRKPIFGYNAIAYSSVAIAVFGFFVWGHHMFVSGMSGTAAIIFSLLTYSVAIPTAVKVFNWLATMYKGSITFESPMLYALTFIFLFVVGGLTGMFLGALGADVHVHDTYFIVAHFHYHFHYTMMGGTVMGLLAGLHFWFPKMTGRMLSEKMARYAWLLMFVGFNVTFFTQFIMGFDPGATRSTRRNTRRSTSCPRWARGSSRRESSSCSRTSSAACSGGSWLPRTHGKRCPWIGRPGRLLPRRISGKSRRSTTGRTATRAGKPDGP
jgi:cytochrome c oxidase subunit 1